MDWYEITNRYLCGMDRAGNERNNPKKWAAHTILKETDYCN